MLTPERHRLILECLAERKTVTVLELTKELDASESTIRRDLSALHEQGKLEKVHGGATLPAYSFSALEEDIPTKAAQNVEEKQRIAIYAASLVTDDDFVFIDSGTTTDKMIDYIGKVKATFVTNSISHIRKLTAKGLKTYILGGQFKPVTEAIVGAMAVNSLRQYNFTKSFLGANGISYDCGITTPDAEEAAVKTTCIEQAYMSYILADSSKFAKVSAVSFTSLEKVCIITSALKDKKYQELTIVKEVDL